MMTLTFDTLQFVQRLKKAGINETEAEAIAEAVRDSQENANMATKQDITALRKEIEVVKAGREAKIAETKADLIRWVVSVGVLQTAIIAALLMRLIPSA
jgi:hypothetical protein